MKAQIIALLVLASCVCQAQVKFQSASEIPLSVQPGVDREIARLCPQSVEQNWDIYESSSQIETSVRGDMVLMKSDFAVYGTSEDGQYPELGGMTLEMVFSQSHPENLHVLNVEGLCR